MITWELYHSQLWPEIFNRHRTLGIARTATFDLTRRETRSRNRNSEIKSEIKNALSALLGQDGCRHHCNHPSGLPSSQQLVDKDDRKQHGKHRLQATGNDGARGIQQNDVAAMRKYPRHPCALAARASAGKHLFQSLRIETYHHLVANDNGWS